MYSISVIIPTYNRCELLCRALSSVFGQGYPAVEVVVVDDGSDDGTAEMINNDFPSVKYYFQENKGVSAARNRGIGLASGEWVAFLDSDDEWLPNKLQSQVDALLDSPEVKVCHTEEIWVRNGKRVNQMNKHRKEGGWIFQRCLPLCAMSPSSIMLRRSIFDEVGGFDENLPACEDYELWLRITARYPVLFIEQPQIIKYGGHEDQLSARYWGMDRFRIYALEKIINANVLSDQDRYAAIDMLIQKCAVYSQGALKRNKLEEADRYQQLMYRYSPA